MAEKTKQQDKVILACSYGYGWTERQMPPLGWPHTIQSLSIQMKGLLDPLLFPLLPTAHVPGLHSSPKARMENTVLRSCSSMQFCPWLYTWNTRVTLDSSLGSSRNFRPQLCQLVVFVMFSVSQLLTKMSRGYIRTPPPYSCSSFKSTLGSRSAILALYSIMLQWFLHPTYFLSHI